MTELVADPDEAPAGETPAAAERRTVARRRSLLRGLGLSGAAVSLQALLPSVGHAQGFSASRPSLGDIAILRFLAAAELIEADLWQQYAELGGVTAGATNTYQAAFANLDDDGSQYITSNTIDEQSHAEFLNAYLASVGAPPVDFSKFATLPGSRATGAARVGRLTNLMSLKVDTTWYTKYRSATNPDAGATFPQALPALAASSFPAIPRTDADFGNASDMRHIQAIANTAAFHFGMIEDAGSSLYAMMAQKTSSAQVLEIVLGIGGDEIAHLIEWVDFAGNAVQPSVAPLTDPTNGLTFPNFNATKNPLLQTNLIFPVPAEFISPNLPKCSTIRPVTNRGITALGAFEGLFRSGLFTGQSDAFLLEIGSIAVAADLAQRDGA